MVDHLDNLRFGGQVWSVKPLYLTEKSFVIRWRLARLALFPTNRSFAVCKSKDYIFLYYLLFPFLIIVGCFKSDS